MNFTDACNFITEQVDTIICAEFGRQNELNGRIDFFVSKQIVEAADFRLAKFCVTTLGLDGEEELVTFCAYMDNHAGTTVVDLVTFTPPFTKGASVRAVVSKSDTKSESGLFGAIYSVLKAVRKDSICAILDYLKA